MWAKNFKILNVSMIHTYTFCGPNEGCRSQICVLWPHKPKHHVTLNGAAALKPTKDFCLDVTNRNSNVTAPEKKSII